MNINGLFISLNDLETNNYNINHLPIRLNKVLFYIDTCDLYKFNITQPIEKLKHIIIEYKNITKIKLDLNKYTKNLLNLHLTNNKLTKINIIVNENLFNLVICNNKIKKLKLNIYPKHTTINEKIKNYKTVSKKVFYECKWARLK